MFHLEKSKLNETVLGSHIPNSSNKSDLVHFLMTAGKNNLISLCSSLKSGDLKLSFYAHFIWFMRKFSMSHFTVHLTMDGGGCSCFILLISSLLDKMSKANSVNFWTISNIDAASEHFGFCQTHCVQLLSNAQDIFIFLANSFRCGTSALCKTPWCD